MLTLQSLAAALVAVSPAVVVTLSATQATATVGETRYSVDLVDSDGKDRSADVTGILADLLRTGP